MPTFVLGMDAKLYYGTAGSTAGTELTNVKDVKIDTSAGEADVTTRANSGWEATAATLKKCSIDFDMIWDTDDAGFLAIRDAFLANDTIAILCLTSAAGDGPDGDFSVTGFQRNEPLAEAVTVSVSLKLAVFREWQEAA